MKTEMKHIRKRLDTLPKSKKEQFWNTVDDMLALLYPDHDHIYESEVYLSEEFLRQKKDILLQAQNAIIQSLSLDPPEKLPKRKHGSKGVKHRERREIYIRNIKEKAITNGINYPLLFKEFFGVELKEKKSMSGIGYIGLCHRHNEKTPSLVINVEKMVARCFGCGYGAQLPNYLSHVFGTSYYQSLSLLEPYIYSHEESKEWQARDLAIRKEYTRRFYEENPPHIPEPIDEDDLPF